MPVVVIAICLFLTGCSADTPTSADTPQVCEQREFAEEYIKDVEADLAKTNPTYLKSEDYEEFVAAYWDGFDESHKGCVICEQNKAD